MFYHRRQVMAIMSAAAAATATGSQAQTIKKVGFILNGTPGDVGWNFEHMRGIEMVKQTFGDAVQVETIFNVGEWGNGDGDQLINMALNQFDLIFACSFGYAQSLLNVALVAKTVKFEHCGGYVRADNMSTYSARWYEGRVPQGLMAGAVTKTNKVGYLASFPIPQVVRGINAAYLAAKSVNPNVEFDVVWLKTWFDPEQEEKVARELAAKGADVLLAHTNSTKPVEVAEELGLHAFGQASDMTKYGPQASLSASINNWGPYYVSRITDLLNDTWKSTDTWGGFAESMIEIGDVNDQVPGGIEVQTADAVAGLRSANTHPFVGPIRKQDGSTWLRAGETATDTDLHQMGFYLEGMTSVYPT